MVKFSVIIPTYRSEKHICKTLDSVKAQTCRNFEIIITDDGSDDNTVEVIRTYISANQEMDIHLYTQTNRGIGAARNHCIRHAGGDFLALLDDDDLWYPCKLEILTQYLNNNPQIDLVSHRMYKTYPSGKKKKYPNSKPKDPCFRSLLLTGNTLAVSATVIRKSALLQVGGFTEDRRLLGVEDYDMWLTLAYLEKKFGFVPLRLGEYFRRPTGCSSRIESMLENVLTLLEANRVNLVAASPESAYELSKAIERRKKREVAGAFVKLLGKKDWGAAIRMLQRLFP